MLIALKKIGYVQ